MLMFDGLRRIETRLVAIEDRQVKREMAAIEDRADMAQAISLALSTSSDALQTRSLVADTNKQITDITTWSRRLALALGLLALSAQHLTIGEVSKLFRIVMGM